MVMLYIPAFLSRQANVRRKVWGLQGRLVGAEITLKKPGSGWIRTADQGLMKLRISCDYLAN
jgi:hypothetical protein